MLFSIGEFSRVTGLTVKALRFYHEEEVLVPAEVDPASGYRYYTAGQVETARAVKLLRELEFPVKEIREILVKQGRQEAVVEVLRRQEALLWALGRCLLRPSTFRKFAKEDRHRGARARAVLTVFTRPNSLTYVRTVDF